MARRKQPKVIIDDVTLEAIRVYAAKHGETWKDKLSTAWMRGDYSIGSTLYAARNLYGAAVFTAV